MTPNQRQFGMMRPLGGGDPIPLSKPELTIGRRKSCDIGLDFDNVSGRHCQLSFVSGVWHVRDLNSTNGTTINGSRLDHEQGLMPDDNLGIATHFFRIDYDPVSPVKDANQLIEEELGDELGDAWGGRKRSLLELAGLTKTSNESDYLFRDGQREEGRPDTKTKPDGDEMPSDFGASSAAPEMSDDDFLDMIRDDLK